MTAGLAPRPWPTTAAVSAAGGRIGRDVELVTDGVARRALQWVLARNCSIKPRQLAAVYLSLCVLSLTIALLFAMAGAPFVLWFAGVELLVLGLAFLVYGRHAADRETITLSNGVVAVEQRCGVAVERVDFQAGWLTVEPCAGQGSLLDLSGQGRRVRIGRHLRPERRADLAKELRLALRLALMSEPTPNP